MMAVTESSWMYVNSFMSVRALGTWKGVEGAKLNRHDCTGLKITNNVLRKNGLPESKTI